MTYWPLFFTVVSSAFLALSVRTLRRKGALSGFGVISLLVANVISFLLAWLGVYAYFFTSADTRELPYVIYALLFSVLSVSQLLNAAQKGVT